MIVLLIFLVVVTNVQVHSQDCSFNVSAENSPFILDDFFQFPTTFNFELEETFYIGCPKGTFNVHIAERGDHVACKGGTNILNIRSLEILDFNSLKCKSIPATTVRTLDDKCENNRTLIEVGIEIFDHFVRTLTVCFDEVKLSTFYVKYNNEYRVSKRKIESYDDGFEDYLCTADYECSFVDGGGVFLNIDMDSLYNNQEEILDNLGVVGDDKLNKLPLAIHIINSDRHRIEAYPYWDYLNVVPVWHSIDNIWLPFYSIAVRTGNVLYTGALGVATLPNTSGEEIELYLKDNKVPVPKWIWILSEGGNPFEKTIYFYYNYSSNPSDEDIKKICEDWEIITSGSIYCSTDAVNDPEMRTFIDNICRNEIC